MPSAATAPTRSAAQPPSARALLDGHQTVRLLHRVRAPSRGRAGAACAGRPPRRRCRPPPAARRRRASRARPSRPRRCVRSVPSRATPASPSGTTSPGLRRRPLDRVEALVLEEDDRVVVADRRLEQALRVRRDSTGAAIFRPGMPWNQVPWICECIAPKRPPPPTAERTTSGTLACSFEMYQYFADWLTRLSIGSAMKSPNMISKTGRSPVTAAPNAAPASASSEIGVSKTRSSPKRSCRPGRGLEDAARGGDVLAEEDHGRVALDLLGERVADRGRGTRASLMRANSVAGVLVGIRDRAPRARPRPRASMLGLARRPPRARAPRRSRPASSEPRAREVERVALEPALDLARAAGTSPGRTSSGRSGGRSGTRAASAPRRARARRPPRRPPRATAHTSLPSTTCDGMP